MTADTVGDLARVAQVTATVEEITPEVAEQYLAHNRVNRNMRPYKVAGYARDMAEGRWLLTGQGVSFDMLGDLIDGQHRLEAIVACGLTIPMIVTRGLAPGAMRVLDTGMKRSTADALGLMGYPNRAVAAAVARLTLLHEKKITTVSLRDGLTASEIIDYAEAHNVEILEAASRATTWRKALPAMTSVTGTAWILLNRVDKNACGEFFESTTSLQTRGTGDPRLTLLRRLGNIQTDRARVSQVQQLNLFIRAWNAWRMDERLEKLPLDGRAVHRDPI